MTPECNDRCLLGLGQGRGVRGLRPGLQILNRCPLAPFCDRLRVDPQLSAQRRERSLRSLYCCSDGVRGRGAPVTYLSHTASFHSNERIAPSNRGIKHLGDRPALTPVESFYQRILANNPDEALAQAEALLADRSLTAYYDGVVLEGLKLAVEDEARGTIDKAGAVRMTRSMLSVIDDLRPPAGAEQTLPSTPNVLCVAGHGTFDDAVTAMLVQLLSHRGLEAKRVPNADVSRETVATLHVTGIDVIAISYLEVTGTPAQLRYLVRRLRGRAPEARIVVGLWPQDEAALSNADIQRMLGADCYAGSLADAVEQIALPHLQPKTAAA